MNAHEVLVSARNLIEREGWRSYGAGASRHSGGRCALGRLGQAEGGGALGDVGYAAACVLAEVVDGSSSGIAVASWNDAPGRTKEEVLAAFDEAIRRTAPPPADPLPRESYEGYCERTRREWDEPKAVPVP